MPESNPLSRLVSEDAHWVLQALAPLELEASSGEKRLFKRALSSILKVFVNVQSKRSGERSKRSGVLSGQSMAPRTPKQIKKPSQTEHRTFFRRRLSSCGKPSRIWLRELLPKGTNSVRFNLFKHTELEGR